MTRNVLYIMFVCLGLLASCAEVSTNDDGGRGVDGSNGGDAVTFSMSAAPTSRAAITGADAATLLGNNFVVYGTKGASSYSNPAADGNQLVFDHYNVNYALNTAGTTESNTSNWEYVNQTISSYATDATGQSIKYWDYSAKAYDFVAFSLSGSSAVTATAVKPATIATDAYSLTGTSADLASAYISDITTMTADDYGKPVSLRFRNFMSKVRVGLFETIPGYDVCSVKFYASSTATNSTTTATLYASKDAMAFVSSSAEYNVYFPTTGNSSATDNNRAHVKTSAAADASSVAFGNLSYVKGEYKNTGASYLGRTSSTASMAGDYANKLPNEQMSQPLVLKVDFTLRPHDANGSNDDITQGCYRNHPCNIRKVDIRLRIHLSLQDF